MPFSNAFWAYNARLTVWSATWISFLMQSAYRLLLHCPMSIPVPHARFRVARLFGGLVLALLIAVSAGCVSKKSKQGVETRWRGETAAVFTQGQTTEREVLAALGPPSQLINLGNRTVFYYLQEQKQAKSLILILYNQTRENISYDRAIFFFDQQGRLTDFARSDEKNSAK